MDSRHGHGAGADIAEKTAGKWPFSLFRLGLWRRMAIAGIVSLMLWSAVVWAVR